MRDIKNFINGEFVANMSGKKFEKRNPVDNSLIGMVYEAGKPEVDAAVAAARAALHGPWGKLSVADRCKLPHCSIVPTKPTRHFSFRSQRTRSGPLGEAMPALRR